jgi:hypothetical protein
LHRLRHAGRLQALATPEPIKEWSLSSLKEKLIKIGAKVITHSRGIVFQMAEVAIPRRMFQEILRLIVVEHEQRVIAGALVMAVPDGRDSDIAIRGLSGIAGGCDGEPSG